MDCDNRVCVADFLRMVDRAQSSGAAIDQVVSSLNEDSTVTPTKQPCQNAGPDSGRSARKAQMPQKPGAGSRTKFSRRIGIAAGTPKKGQNQGPTGSISRWLQRSDAEAPIEPKLHPSEVFWMNDVLGPVPAVREGLGKQVKDLTCLSLFSGSCPEHFILEGAQVSVQQLATCDLKAASWQFICENGPHDDRCHHFLDLRTLSNTLGGTCLQHGQTCSLKVDDPCSYVGAEQKKKTIHVVSAGFRASHFQWREHQGHP